MHSSHHSRGRIFFDFFCVLVVVASCMGAWIQTGATALIGAAAAAGLYGLVRLTDTRWPQSAEAAVPQRISFEPEARDDLPVVHEVIVPFAAAEPMPTVEETALEAEPVELKVPRAKERRPAKASRKGNTRRSGSAKAAKGPEPAQSDEPEPFVPRVVEESHTHVAPLFEPEPFVRMPRQAFGRRGQI
jgi:hypothetical protein